MFSKNITFPKAEEEVLEFWRNNRSFEKSIEGSKDRPAYVFYDGPPFATGLPHYGHILSGSIKDTVGRFWHQQGFYVERRFGWDCHGLPVEYEIDKKLDIKDRQQVLDMGIAAYNDKCKEIVMKYSNEWEKTVERMGRWVDFKNGYKTMDKSFMESTWFIFKQLWDRNLIYRGFKIMPFSTGCKTPLSNFEANQNYQNVSDPSVLIAFPLVKPLKGRTLSLVAWTTTPWTLPANCGLIVNEGFKYDIFEYKEKFYVVYTDRVAEYFKDYKVVDSVLGSELIGLEYSPPFDFFEHLRSKGFFQVISGSFVSDSNGTAIVHAAPAFGEEDYETFVKQGLIKINDEVPCPVDENGHFTLGKYKGVYIKDLDPIILKDIKERVLMNNRIVHSYPFCWRSDTPLIYKLVPNWFVRVQDHREALLRCNEDINWIPETIKYKRFHNWLAQSRDWAISRNRFWGTPLPIWITEDYSDMICVGSVSELEELSGTPVKDLHRQFVDDILIKKDGKVYKRVEEVLDCWFESGSMPYSQSHWPFSGKEVGQAVGSMQLSDEGGYLHKEGFPADFIGEGLDQTRGWFYTLHVISTLLFNRPAFRNVIVNGIIQASDGKKMSKRKNNYPDPKGLFDMHGADALRLYLFNTPAVEADNINFSEVGIKDALKTLLIPWYNSLAFLNECLIGEEATEMDPWICSSFNTFCYGVTKSMKQYRLNAVPALARSFIDDLSNWYIRINRKTLRSGAGLLRKLLKDFSIVMAPFAPFFSEFCYQSVRNSSDLISVHDCMYPSANHSEHSFYKAKKVIESIRQMREKLRLKVKRPLKAVTIVCTEALRSVLEEYVGVIQNECNLLDLVFGDERDYEFSTTVKPFFENIKKDEDSKKKKIDIIKGLSIEKALGILENPLEVDGVTISGSDLLISKEFKDESNSGVFGDYGIILDTETNDTITRLFEAREFYSFIQKLRKKCGLSVEDKVAVSIANDYIKEIISNTDYKSLILFGDEGEVIGEEDYTFNDCEFKTKLYKLGE